MMHLSLGPTPAFENPLAPAQIEATVTNTTQHTITFWLWPSMSLDVGGRRAAGMQMRILNQSGENEKTTLAAGESLRTRIELRLALAPFRGQSGKINAPVTLRAIFSKPSDGDVPKDTRGEPDYDALMMPTSVDISLPINLTEVEWMMRDDGGPSVFYRLHGTIYEDQNAAPSPVPAHEPAHAKAVTRQLIDDGKHLHFGDFSKRKRPAGDVIGLNSVFYRADESIWTEYGNAKVDDPATFEVLDEGCASLFSSLEGYNCSYARDAGAAYYFCGSTSTTKAIKLRGCKSPDRLVSLDGPFAKDDRNVYLEGRAIKGADPATFAFITRHYWRDAKGIGYLSRRAEVTDPDTFEVVPEYHKGRILENIPTSSWGQDAQNIYRRGYVRRDDD